MSSYEDKKQARIDYYREKAEKATKESHQLYKSSMDIISGVPPGQPILIDHPAGKKLSNCLDDHNNKMRKSLESTEKAAYYADKANAAESNTAISADDPEAINRLEEKLKQLEKKQAEMKEINAYYRMYGSCAGCYLCSDKKVKELDAAMEEASARQTSPFSGWQLTNNNANIHTIRKRIENLKKQREVGYAGWEFAGGKAVPNAEENRLQLFFDTEPPEEQRRILSSSGFHWSRYNNAWQRQLNGNAIYAASRIDFIQPMNGKSIIKLQLTKKKNEQQC